MNFVELKINNYNFIDFFNKNIIVGNNKNTNLNNKDNNNNNDDNKDNNTDNNNKENYDDTTTKYYKALRISKCDPITLIDIDSNYIFEFKYKWDPYTGIITEEDIDGPLCFDVHSLYCYFYNNRLKNLWNESLDQNYSGYYGDLVGIGNEYKTNSGTTLIEKNLFRLPIINCYLPKKYDMSIITMGPELSDDDIKLIDSKINEKYLKTNYNIKYTPLEKIKELYSKAIDNKITYTENINYVNMLKKI